MRRPGIGLLLVLHGLAHAGLAQPARAAAEGLTPTVGAVELGWRLALAGFVAAGLGLMGAPPWRRHWRGLALVAALGSALALVAGGAEGRWVGVVLTVGLAGMVVQEWPLPDVTARRAARRPWLRRAGAVGAAALLGYMLAGMVVPASDPDGGAPWAAAGRLLLGPPDALLVPGL